MNLETTQVTPQFTSGDRVEYTDAEPGEYGIIRRVDLSPMGNSETYRVEYVVEWDDNVDNGVYVAGQLRKV